MCLCVIAFEDFYRNTIFKNLASLSDKLITNGGFFICSTSSHSDAKISTFVVGVGILSKMATVGITDCLRSD